MMSPQRPFIIAGIPAYDEETNIGKVVVNAQKLVDKVIVCDDGSGDMTAEIAGRLGADVVRHEKNGGYGSAIRSLFLRAREMGADILVTLDADGQHNPEDIKAVIAPIMAESADMSIGMRDLGAKGGIPGYRRRGISFISSLTRTASGTTVMDSQSGFRAYSRKALSMVGPSEQGMGVSTEILIKAADKGLRITEVPIKVRYNLKTSTSTHTPMYQALDVIGSTIKHVSIRHPLVFFGLPGLIFSAIGLLFGFWALSIYESQRQVLISVTLIAAGSLILGAILATTAVILYTIISVVRDRA